MSFWASLLSSAHPFQQSWESFNWSPIFVQRLKVLQKNGIHPRMRTTEALQMLAYSSAADALDDYLQISDDSLLHSMIRFCQEVVNVFCEEYLRHPTNAKLHGILRRHVTRCFPGCFSSIDCLRWPWKYRPVACPDQLTGKVDKQTIILEAISNGQFWIWDYFESPGSPYDSHVLDPSFTMGPWWRACFHLIWNMY